MAGIIDEIRKKIDLVDLVSDYLPLKKVGSSYRALCPFHSEKTPSFYVSPQKQIWKCFGCGRAGEHFKFLMEYEHVDFKEALKILASKAGIELKNITPKTKDKIDELLEIHRISAKFFHEKLQLNEDILNYLKKRGVTKESIEDFQLGFAGPGLSEFLLNLGFGKEVLIDSGIFYEKNSRIINRFEGRLIFPLLDHKGFVIGFSGRTLTDDEPKYLNSPETPIFKKGENFYGFYLALPFIKESQEVYLVEGFFDLILAWQQGLKNILAILGTALTPFQVKLLNRFVKKIIFAFDNDEAGETAVFKSSLLVAQTEIETFRAIYGKKDLGEFLIDHHLNEIKKEDLLDYWLKSKEPAKLMEILPFYLASINNLARRVQYLQKIQEYDIIKIEWLKEEIDKAKKLIPQIDFGENLPEKSEIKKKVSRYELLVELIVALVYGLGKKELLEELKEFLPQNLDEFESVWELRFEYEKSLNQNKNLDEYLAKLIKELKKEYYRQKIKELSLQKITPQTLEQINNLIKNLKEIYDKEKR